ncbi:hypothetical protein [Nostoc sp.]|uniref:hypothetical protein n=1 Tax=Nostoc sp. TaxID=1180 RepID=UPI0039C9549B
MPRTPHTSAHSPVSASLALGFLALVSISPKATSHRNSTRSLPPQASPILNCCVRSLSSAVVVVDTFAVAGSFSWKLSGFPTTSVAGSVHPLCSLVVPLKIFIKQVRDNPCCSAKALRLLPSTISPVGDRKINFLCLRSGGVMGCPSGVQCRHPLCIPMMHLESRDRAIGSKLR